MRLLILSLSLLFVNLTFGQQLEISGNVLDGSLQNQPLAFASIEVEGLDITVQSEFDGSYTLNLTQGTYNLIVDFVGYETRKIKDVKVGDKNINLPSVVLNAIELKRDVALESDNI